MTSNNQPDNAAADDDLLRRVKRLLAQRHNGPHRSLEVSAEQGVVVIQGRVPTFYLRQIAVECIKRVAGVVRVIDLIEVVNDLRQYQLAENTKDNQESSTVSKQHRRVLQDATRTVKDQSRLSLPDTFDSLGTALIELKQ